MPPVVLKVQLRKLPPAVPTDAVSRAVDAALAPLGAKAVIVYTERGRISRDGMIRPTRICLEVRPAADGEHPDAAVSIIAALSRQCVESEGENGGRCSL